MDKKLIATMMIASKMNKNSFIKVQWINVEQKKKSRTILIYLISLKLQEDQIPKAKIQYDGKELAKGKVQVKIFLNSETVANLRFWQAAGVNKL